jgi:hypothetical protein
MQIHQTKEFKDWYSKSVYTQPSGAHVQKDFSMLCFIISFSGRIMDADSSLDAWINSYTKFRPEAIIHTHDKNLYQELWINYNMKTSEQLGLGDEKLKRIPKPNTEMSTNPRRESINTWDEEPVN